jgi:hypothetical protein
MSIDARVDCVIINEDGSGKLCLVDRPARPGGVPGIAGQRALSFDMSPKEVTALKGLDVWGGAGSLMLGDVQIADRLGCTWIAFHARDVLVKAVAAYHRRHGP